MNSLGQTNSREMCRGSPTSKTTEILTTRVGTKITWSWDRCWRGQANKTWRSTTESREGGDRSRRGRGWRTRPRKFICRDLGNEWWESFNKLCDWLWWPDNNLMFLEFWFAVLACFTLSKIMRRHFCTPDYTGQTVWITGASSGIGEYLAY